jgi:hypothetical protein
LLGLSDNRLGDLLALSANVLDIILRNAATIASTYR